MALKPNGRQCVIAEQIIEDMLTGLTIQIRHAGDDAEAPVRIHIQGPGLPFGNRDLVIDHNGECVAMGTSTVPICRPSWLSEVETDQAGDTE